MVNLVRTHGQLNYVAADACAYCHPLLRLKSKDKNADISDPLQKF